MNKNGNMEEGEKRTAEHNTRTAVAPSQAEPASTCFPNVAASNARGYMSEPHAHAQTATPSTAQQPTATTEALAVEEPLDPPRVDGEVQASRGEVRHGHENAPANAADGLVSIDAIRRMRVEQEDELRLLRADLAQLQDLLCALQKKREMNAENLKHDNGVQGTVDV